MRASFIPAADTAAPFVRGDAPAKPLTPAEAATKVNEQVTVRMEVKNVGKARDGSVIFLNSEKNYRDDTNFTVFINRDALAKFKEAKVDPAADYQGKTIQVTGKVVLYNKHPEIVVGGPDAIAIVDKADAPKAADPPKPSELDGEWSMVSGSANGSDLPESMVKTGQRVAKNGETTISLNGQLFFKAKYTIDASKKPAVIDYDM